MDDFRQAEKAKGMNTILYDDPYNYKIGEKEIVTQLNQQLAINKDYKLPEGYKASSEKQYHFQYNLPSSLTSQINEPYQMASQILNELIHTHFNFNLNEYSIQQNTIYHALPFNPKKKVVALYANDDKYQNNYQKQNNPNNNSQDKN